CLFGLEKPGNCTPFRARSIFCLIIEGMALRLAGLGNDRPKRLRLLRSAQSRKTFGATLSRTGAKNELSHKCCPASRARHLTQSGAGLLSAAQAAVDVGDLRSAAVEIVQTGLAKAAIRLLARRVQPLAADMNVLAREPVIAGRYSASMRAVQTAVIVDDLAA